MYADVCMRVRVHTDVMYQHQLSGTLAILWWYVREVLSVERCREGIELAQQHDSCHGHQVTGIPHLFTIYWAVLQNVNFWKTDFKDDEVFIQTITLPFVVSFVAIDIFV